jgi:hypothetical protein
MKSMALAIWRRRLSSLPWKPAAGQHLQPVQAFARAVGVDGGHRAVVAGAHGLQHFQHLAAAHFAHHDAVRAHPQAVAQQVADRDRALPSKPPGRLQPHHVRDGSAPARPCPPRDHALGGRHEVASALSSEVLPELVPPETRMLQRAAPRLQAAR